MYSYRHWLTRSIAPADEGGEGGGGGGGDAGKSGADGDGGEKGDEGTGDESKTHTQADVDRIVKERLARQKDQFKDYDDLKKQAAELQKLKDAEKPEIERLTNRVGELEKLLGDKDAELTKRDRDALRAKIAAKHKLSEELAGRIAGETEEEMDADAAALAKLIGPKKAPDTDAGKGANGGEKAGGDGDAKPQSFRFQNPGDVKW